jgi:polysaccharide biosynthesis protein PelA
MRSPRLAGLAALAILATAVAPDAGATPRDKRLRAVHTWGFAIGDGDLNGDLVKRYARYDLLIVDGEGASARQVAQLRRAGKIVLAYLDVGTIEPGRSWYGQLKPYRLAYWPDWGEWYAEVSNAGFRHAIAESIAPAILRKGFDGLFLDNTDMIESYSKQTSGMRTLVRQLAGLVHGRHELLFAQNGEDSIGPLLRYYDGWNREDVTATYDFGLHRYVVQPHDQIAAAQRALRRMSAAGLLTLATDYVARGNTGTASLAVANACAAGALPFVSDINLTRVPALPPAC